MDLLRSQYSGFPPGRIIPSESPDFVLQTGRHYRIGIEITRLTKGPISALLPSAQSNRFTLQDINYAMSRKEEKRTLYQKKKTERTLAGACCGIGCVKQCQTTCKLEHY